MQFTKVYKHYRSELNKVESLLFETVKSENQKLTDSAQQLLRAGGKRIRPLFVIMSSQLGKTEHRGQVYAVAAALEMIHMASLVHDDVIDNAAVRRGKPTVRALYGDRAAMYTGDFLFARAIQLLSGIHDFRIHREVSDAMVRVCEGEIDQIRDFFNWQQNVRTYLRRVERKTALLISVSCSLGGLASSCNDFTVKHLRRFGYYTGMAFQITDDLLDFEGDEAIVGKPVGGDLRQGNLTLPTLYAGHGAHKNELRQMVQSSMTNTTVTEAIRLIKKTDALTMTRDLADRYLQKAVQELEVLEKHPVIDELMAVAVFVNRRSY